MNHNQIITWGISLGALILSVTTIIITRKNLKKQLRLAKLEEILEILYYLNGYYFSMFRVFIGIEHSIESLMKSNDITEAMKETIKYRKGFLDQIDRKTMTDKISRLIVLSNAYLDNSKNLKIRIHTIAKTYYHMYMFISLDGDPTLIKKEKNAVIPNVEGMQNFMSRIEHEIIIEMNLGYKPINEKARIDYFNTKFKNDVMGM